MRRTRVRLRAMLLVSLNLQKIAHFWIGNSSVPLNKPWMGTIQFPPMNHLFRRLHESHVLFTRRFVERCPSWPKEHDWKSCVLSKAAPRVRIPLSPPSIVCRCYPYSSNETGRLRAGIRHRKGCCKLRLCKPVGIRFNLLKGYYVVSGPRPKISSPEL